MGSFKRVTKFNHFVMKKIKLLTFLTIHLMLASTALQAQVVQQIIISSEPFYDGGYTYDWQPAEDCYFGVQPVGNIVITWTCSPGQQPVMTFDFSGLSFVTTDPGGTLFDQLTEVVSWAGVLPPAVPPTGSFYPMQFAPLGVPGITTGLVDFDIEFYFFGEVQTGGTTNIPTFCHGTLALPPFEFGCDCLETPPVVDFDVTDEYFLNPGVDYEFEHYFELTDVSTGSNYERKWTVLYYTGNHNYFTEEYDEPTITVLREGWTTAPNGQSTSFIKGLYVTLEVWNCAGHDEKKVHTYSFSL